MTYILTMKIKKWTEIFDFVVSPPQGCLDFIKAKAIKKSDSYCEIEKIGQIESELFFQR